MRAYIYGKLLLKTNDDALTCYVTREQVEI